MRTSTGAPVTMNGYSGHPPDGESMLVAEDFASPAGFASPGRLPGPADFASPANFTSAGEYVDGLYREHAVSLVRIALLLLGDQHGAEDVVQDAFLGLQRSLPRLRDPGKALPYLRTSVVNGCRSVQRSRSRARLRRVQHEPPVWSAESAAIASEDRRAVLAAVATLPERAREVLALRYYLDLSDVQIAGILHVTRSTVSSTASRALVTLARKLEEQQ